MLHFNKNIVSYFKIKIFELPKGQSVGVKFDSLDMLIFRHWVIIAFSENLSDIIALGKCEFYYPKKLMYFLH